MPNSLRARLNKLEYQGKLSKKDLDRIIVVPDGATNGEVLSELFGISSPGRMTFYGDWWNRKFSYLKDSSLKGVLIPELSIPQYCSECPCYNRDWDACNLTSIPCKVLWDISEEERMTWKEGICPMMQLEVNKCIE